MFEFKVSMVIKRLENKIKKGDDQPFIAMLTLTHQVNRQVRVQAQSWEAIGSLGT